jgi:hypothetical protein
VKLKSFRAFQRSFITIGKHNTPIPMRSRDHIGVRIVLVDDLEQVYITSLEGLGSSYRMKGYFTMKLNHAEPMKILFDGVAFGGNYGGHNVNVSISEDEKQLLLKEGNDASEEQLEELLTEIQRRLLNNEMIVEYDSIKPEKEENLDGFGKI